MGSCVFGYAVDVIGTEIDFYKALKSYITGLDTRITCNTDVDEEFDRSEVGDDHIATLSFKINNVSAFKLYRGDVLYTNNDWKSTAYIVFGMDVGSGFNFGTKSMLFKTTGLINDGVKPLETVGRGLFISSIINEDFIFIRFCTIKNGYSDSNTSSVLYSFSNNSTFISSSVSSLSAWDKANCFDIHNYTLYDRSLIVPYGTFLSRFNYAAPAGEIDYIKSSIYQNSNEKRFENTSLFDCTTVTAGSTVSLNDGAYLAVGPHQLVKVS